MNFAPHQFQFARLSSGARAKAGGLSLPSLTLGSPATIINDQTKSGGRSGGALRAGCMGKCRPTMPARCEWGRAHVRFAGRTGDGLIGSVFLHDLPQLGRRLNGFRLFSGAGCRSHATLAARQSLSDQLPAFAQLSNARSRFQDFSERSHDHVKNLLRGENSQPRKASQSAAQKSQGLGNA